MTMATPWCSANRAETASYTNVWCLQGERDRGGAGGRRQGYRRRELVLLAVCVDAGAARRLGSRSLSMCVLFDIFLRQRTRKKKIMMTHWER